jgi:hypothetical protein
MRLLRRKSDLHSHCAESLSLPPPDIIQSICQKQRPQACDDFYQARSDLSLARPPTWSKVIIHTLKNVDTNNHLRTFIVFGYLFVRSVSVAAMNRVDQCMVNTVHEVENSDSITSRTQ